MSKRKIDITKNVMSKIKTKQIKMKPKYYFLFGSLFIFFALVSLIIISIFLISLITFSLKSHGPMGTIRYQQIISNFPWWAPIIIIIGLVTGIILLKKYDFSYKKNFLFVVTIFISAVLLAGVLIDLLGFDNLWIKRGPMKKFYQQYNSDYKQEWNNNIINNGRGGRNFK